MYRKLTIMILWIQYFSVAVSDGQSIVINEFMSDNESSIKDEDGDYSDWIELYNKTASPISLLGYSLSDDRDHSDKWVFPEITLMGNEFLIVFASGKNRKFINELHTDFKISSEGEVLSLFDQNGSLIDQIDPVDLSDDEVFGLLPDGGDNKLKLDIPTPGGTNESRGVLLFSHQSGFYSSPIYERIISPAGEDIYYTLDGSSPTVDSFLYTDSILLDYRYTDPNYWSEKPTTEEQSIIDFKAWEPPSTLVDKAHILRSASFSNGKRTSKIYTHTYFVDSLISGKYEMPVISLVTDEKNFFDPDSGIYVPGKFFDPADPEWTGNYFQRGEEWERSIHIEYFDRNGVSGFSQDAGVRIQGAKTRHAAQKSLRLYARKKYGSQYFNYPLLPQKEVKEYKKFVLRATMGTWGGQTLITDVLAHEIASQLDIEYQDYQPAVVFLNGEYWGIQTIRDNLDDRFIEYTYSIDKDSVEFLSYSNTHYSNLINFISEKDLSIEANYEYVTTQIDISNYIDYNISEMFFGNRDWPDNNMSAWRSQTSNPKWRWIFFDLDGAFSVKDYDMLIHSTTGEDRNSKRLLNSLFQSEKFKDQFVSRYAEVLNNNFKTSDMIKALDLIKSQYEPEMQRHISRWNYPNSFSSWEEDIEIHLSDFLFDRPCNVERHIIEFFDLNEFAFNCSEFRLSDGEKKNLTIAPNPSTVEIFIYNNTIRDVSSGKVEIINVEGQVVYKQEDISCSPNERFLLDLSQLPANFYILNFESAQFSSAERIIILN